MLMRCINPIVKNYNTNYQTNKKIIDFRKNVDLKKPFYSFGCGKCLYCMRKYSNNWAVRLQQESELHKKKCFISLTYNDDNLPKNGTLQKRDLQLFIKRLRKKIQPQKIRYFATGEYGSRRQRAHYHIILFGYQPSDLRYWKTTGKNENTYLSDEIENLWGKGFINIGLNMEGGALKYLSKYLAKLTQYDKLTQLPPFMTCSTKPGLGAGAITDYKIIGRKIEYYNFDKTIYETDAIYLNGKKLKIPKYYDKIAEKVKIDLTEIKDKRERLLLDRGYQEITQQQKRDYKNYIDREGYTINHLFDLGKKHKREILHNLVKKETGEITEKVKKAFYQHYDNIIKWSEKEWNK